MSVGADLPLCLLQIIDQILDSADFQVPFSRKRNAALTPEHARAQSRRLPRDLLAVVDNLAYGSGLCLAGEAAEIDGGFGVASPRPHTARGGTERQDVPGAAKARGRGVRIGQRPDGQGAVAGTDARGDGRIGGIDGDGIRGAPRVLAVDNHLRQLEELGA